MPLASLLLDYKADDSALQLLSGTLLPLVTQEAVPAVVEDASTPPKVVTVITQQTKPVGALTRWSVAQQEALYALALLQMDARQ